MPLTHGTADLPMEGEGKAAGGMTVLDHLVVVCFCLCVFVCVSYYLFFKLTHL